MSENANYPYYDENLERNLVNSESMFAGVVDLLEHPTTREQAELGNLTLAMVRPHVGPTANLLGIEDYEASQTIEEKITGLGVAAKFSVFFDDEVIDEFYAGDPQAVMMKAEPEDSSRFDNRWPEFKEFMTSGPTTILLLHSPNGYAVDLWRAHLGHWNIEKFRDPETIRGALAVNVWNNLVHGSDSPSSVVRELRLIARTVGSPKA